MANVIFKKCIADETYLTPKAKYDSLAPHDAGTFYLVGSELYLGDTLLSADTAAEIGVEDVATYFTGTTVEAVLAELYEAQLAKTIYITEDSTSVDYAKVYSIYQGSEGTPADPVAAELIGNINIPKDLVVKSGSVVDIVFVEGTSGDPDTLHEGSSEGPDVTAFIKGTDPATEADAGKYIKLVIANNEATPLYIAAKSLVDIYKGGTTAEATVAIDANNVITATINKVSATKIIYQAAAEAVYTVEVVADAADFAAKVADPGLYTESAGVYTKITTEEYDSTATYYVLTTPAVEEVTIKDQVDTVDGKVDNLADYVGTFTPQPGVDTVVEYIDTKTGEGVGALNSEAVVATKVGDVVTIKGGIVETSGLIDNSVADITSRTKVEGYFNPADSEFYQNYDGSTYSDVITPVETTEYYEDVTTPASPVDYVWTGKAYVLVRADIVLEEVAVTGDSADVSYDNAASGLTADDVQEAIDELAGTLTWNEV